MRSSVRRRLSAEFARFLADAPPAPAGAKRIFGFALALFEDRFDRWLPPWEFLSALYQVLDGRPGKGKGLLRDFDPGRYDGKLTRAGHFLNVLGKRLRAALNRRLRARGHYCHPRERAKFPHQPRLGLVREGAEGPSARRAAGRDLDGERVDVSRVPGLRPAATSRHGLGRYAGDLPEALEGLSELEQVVVHLSYWGDLSDRAIGRELRLSHKAVGRRLGVALNKLKAFFREELAELAA